MWNEITYNLPVTMWYTDHQYMNTTYWPLDYPPLCAYAHWLTSQVVHELQPNAIKLGESYGYAKG